MFRLALGCIMWQPHRHTVPWLIGSRPCLATHASPYRRVSSHLPAAAPTQTALVRCVPCSQLWSEGAPQASMVCSCRRHPPEYKVQSTALRVAPTHTQTRAHTSLTGFGAAGLVDRPIGDRRPGGNPHRSELASACSSACTATR